MPIYLRHGGFEPITAKNRVAERASTSPDFDFMFPALIGIDDAHLPKDDPEKVISNLVELAKAMVEPTDSDIANATIPPVYTYWGQFIDHDITAGTNDLSTQVFERGIMQPPATFHPWARDDVTKHLKNLRVPSLTLDSVYDEGPENDTVGIYQEDKIRLSIGQTTDLLDDRMPHPELGNERDLPRFSAEDATEDNPERSAKIGDSRNDENLIVAQFHVAVIKFHNATVEWLLRQGQVDETSVFSYARQLTTWHFQWLCVNDYLKTICMPHVVDRVLFATKPLFDAQPVFMPVEFSAAAFRFGHSMVRNQYDFNENFGRSMGEQGALKERAPLRDLFVFTGNRGFPPNEDGSGERLPTLPDKWIIDWTRFLDPFSPHTDRFARKLDIHLAGPLNHLTDDLKNFAEHHHPIHDPYLQKVILRLAVRNLVRGYLFDLPTGQAVADYLGLKKLPPQDILNSTDASTVISGGGFQHRSPLWFYILKEAEIQALGNSLGEVGSFIVARTLISLLRCDENSYLRQVPVWHPYQGVTLGNGKMITKLHDFFKFAGVVP